MADTDAKTLAELEAEREEIEESLAQNKAIVTNLNLKRIAKKYLTADEKIEFAEAKSAVRFAGIDHQSVLREIGLVKRQTQDLLPDNHFTFALCFLDVAHEELDDETLKTIKGKTHARRRFYNRNGAEGEKVDG